MKYLILTMLTLSSITVANAAVVSLKNDFERNASIRIDENRAGFNILFQDYSTRNSCFISKNTYEERARGLLRRRYDMPRYMFGVTGGLYDATSSSEAIFLVSPLFLATIPLDIALLPAAATARMIHNASADRRIKRAFDKNKDLSLNYKRFNYFTSSLEDLCSKERTPLRRPPSSSGRYSEVTCEITREGRIENQDLELNFQNSLLSSISIAHSSGSYYKNYELEIFLVNNEINYGGKLELGLNSDRLHLGAIEFSQDSDRTSKKVYVNNEEIIIDCRIQ